MADSLFPWICKYLTQTYSNSEASFSTFQPCNKGKMVQIVGFFPFTRRIEEDEVWAMGSDKDCRIPIVFSKKAITSYNANNAKKLTDLKTALVTIKDYKPDFTFLPNGSGPGQQKYLILRCDILSFKGSDGEAPFGNPINAEDHPALREIIAKQKRGSRESIEDRGFDETNGQNAKLDQIESTTKTRPRNVSEKPAKKSSRLAKRKEKDWRELAQDIEFVKPSTVDIGIIHDWLQNACVFGDNVRETDAEPPHSTAIKDDDNLSDYDIFSDTDKAPSSPERFVSSWELTPEKECKEEDSYFSMPTPAQRQREKSRSASLNPPSEAIVEHDVQAWAAPKFMTTSDQVSASQTESTKVRRSASICDGEIPKEGSMMEQIRGDKEEEKKRPRDGDPSSGEVKKRTKKLKTTPVDNEGKKGGDEARSIDGEGKKDPMGNKIGGYTVELDAIETGTGGLGWIGWTRLNEILVEWDKRICSSVR